VLTGLDTIAMRSLELSKDFLVEANKAYLKYRQSKSEEKLRQACEKYFAALGQAINWYKGRELHHSEYNKVVEELVMKTGKTIFRSGHMAAELLHARFYQDILSTSEIEESMKTVIEAIEALKSLKL